MPVGSLFTVAVFEISVPLSKSPTVTWKDKVFVSYACKSTFIPFANVSAVSCDCTSSSTFMLPSTNVVPSGTVSFTVTVVGAVPVELSSVIVYVIVFPTFTSVPLAGSAVLLGITFGLFTVSTTVSVSTSFTVAVFVISLSNTP